MNQGNGQQTLETDQPGVAARHGKTMRFHLKIWRQKNPRSEGQMVDYEIDNIPPGASFLEMLDILNERLVERGEDPIEHDSDCREGICGTCSLVINGIPHGGQRGSATCQLHMRTFQDGDTIYVEPWRARPFPVIKDLVVDRAAFDRIIQAGGYVSVRTGSAPDANALPVPKVDADLAMDAAACIGCGACVAACKNSSAMLYTAAKISHLNLLPQGQAEKHQRVLNMVRQMDKEGFGGCTNQYECSAVCPKEIDAAFIAKMNREYALASLRDITMGNGTAVD
jgi:succinate dehydrogenase / fumarate reductase iron-sulfur subunit